MCSYCCINLYLTLTNAFRHWKAPAYFKDNCNTTVSERVKTLANGKPHLEVGSDAVAKLNNHWPVIAFCECCVWLPTGAICRLIQIPVVMRVDQKLWSDTAINRVIQSRAIQLHQRGSLRTCCAAPVKASVADAQPGHGTSLHPIFRGAPQWTLAYVLSAVACLRLPSIHAGSRQLSVFSSRCFHTVSTPAALARARIGHPFYHPEKCLQQDSRVCRGEADAHIVSIALRVPPLFMLGGICMKTCSVNRLGAIQPSQQNLLPQTIGSSQEPHHGQSH